jgi:hypothetical protein
MSKRASTLSKLVSVLIISALALHYYKKYFTEEKEVRSEGFTQLLYSRMRPQTRNARLFYEEYFENSLKYIDRIRYNLGMR